MLITDSICVKILDSNSILAGVGNELRHFYLDNESGETKINIFPERLTDKIHGIYSMPCDCNPNDHDIIICGGREFITLLLTNNRLRLCARTKVTDWISSLKFFGSYEICLLTTHNVACRIPINWKSTKHCEIIDKLSCPDNATLYCSLIIGNDWETAKFFGGTAMGEVLLWQKLNGQEEIVHRIKAHNGAIFSINCNLEYNLMTTTSDDRSIKIWEFICPPGGEDDKFNLTECEIKPKRALFGHTARVFRSKIIFYGDTEATKPYIVSIGEDQNVCLWNIAGALLYRKKLGATLWGLDYCPKKKIIYTSGNDGNIKQLPLLKILNKTQFKHDTYLQNDLPMLQPNEYFTKIKFINYDNRIVGATNQQRLFCQVKDDDNDGDQTTTKPTTKGLKFKLVNEQPPSNICLLETKGSLVIVGGVNKNFDIYQLLPEENELSLVFENMTIMQQMIRAIKFLNQNEFIVSDMLGNCVGINLLKYQHELIEYRFKLPKSKERWITAVLRINDFLIVSDRCGNLYLYEINWQLRSAVVWCTLKEVNGDYGCTDLAYCPENNRIATTGHNGVLNYLNFNQAQRTIEIYLTMKIPILWTERIYLDELVAVGFNDKHFVIWSCEHDRGEIVDEINCGGGHRFWDFLIKSDKFQLIYIRNKELHFVELNREQKKQKILPIHENSQMKFQFPLSNWHLKSCTVVETIQIGPEVVCFVSGGDDNILKFSQFNLTTNKLENIQNITTHISSIKSIYVKKLTEGQQKYLIFSVGGRAQCCVTSLTVIEQNSTELNENRYQLQEITTFMLNSSDKERKRLGTANEIDYDAETRFMSICFRKNNMIIGCSDGLIRQFSYKDNKIYSTTSKSYNRCILHVDSFVLINNDDKDDNELTIVITMATDGRICFWELKSFDIRNKNNENAIDKPFGYIEHHKSGIQTYSIIFTENMEKMIIATGGDDQSVVISHITINHYNSFRNNFNKQIITSRLPVYHIAQVNGVKFSTNKKFLYTTGVDQKIFQINLSTLEIKEIGNSCISDIKGLCIIPPPPPPTTTTAETTTMPITTNDNDDKNHPSSEDRIFVYGYGIEEIKKQI